MADELRVAAAWYLIGPAVVTHKAPLVCLVDLDCPYFLRHVVTALGRRPWWRLQAPRPPQAENNAAASNATAEPPPPACALCEYERVPWDAVLRPPHVVTNNLLVRKGLSRKAQFARYTSKHATKCPGCPLATSVPFTAIVDMAGVWIDRPAWLDLRSAVAEALCDASDALSSAPDGTLWILKPSMANKGAEISIVSTMEQVERAVREWRDVGQWVLQRYVEAPLTLSGGRKWHLRVYVLADGALAVHVFQEALMLFAAAPYPEKAELQREGGAAAAGGPPHDRFAHLTNTCVGAEAGDSDEELLVHTLGELPALLLEAGCCASAANPAAAAAQAAALVWQRVEQCIVHTFLALEGEFSGFSPLRNAFELYGVDFLVDEAMGVHLLEFNPTPDVKQTGSRLDHVIAALAEGMLSVALDGRWPPPMHMQQLQAQWRRRESSCSREAAQRLSWRCVLERDWPGAAGDVNMRMHEDD